MNLDDARKIAADLVYRLAPGCERIEIAGSVRRCKATVKDIEIVAVPRMEIIADMFGNQVAGRSLLDPLLTGAGHQLKGGDRYKQIFLPQGINLDLFLVLPPACWGVIFAIRTGPGNFSQALVTQANKGGLLPSWCTVANGNVYDTEHKEHGFANEIDFLEFCKVGERWHSPVERQELDGLDFASLVKAVRNG